MSESLRQKTVSGLKWSGIEKLFQQLFVFFAGVFLARQLNLQDYGLVAILSIFSYLANAIQESGFSAALIRKKDVTEADYNTVFWFNISISILLYCILYLCAPAISLFYDEPQLTILARVIFLSIIINSFAIVQNAQIIKSINYKLNTQIGILSIILSYGLALIMAYNGFGVWSLVAQIVVSCLCRTVLMWIGNRWKPRFTFSITAFKEMFGFSSSMLLISILYTFSSRLTPSIIGRQLGVSAAGIFETGDRMYSSAMDFVLGTILNVSFPVLSKVEDESELKRIYRKITRASSFLIFPFFMGLALVAKPFILVSIGQKWEASIMVLQLLAICGIPFSLNTLCVNVLKVKGKASYILSTQILYTILIFSSLFIGILLKFDLYQFLIGIVVANFFGYIINLFVVKKILEYTILEYLKDVLPYFFISLISIAVGFTLNYFVYNLIVLFALQIVVVAVIYASISYFSGSKIIKELISLVKTKNI